MLFESLVVKGVIVAGKYIAAHGLATKASLVLGKLIISKGLATTIATTITAGAVVGLVVWTKDRIKLLQKGVTALIDKDYPLAAKSFAKLAVSTNLHVDSLSDEVYSCLVKNKFSVDDAKNVAKGILSLKSEIESEINRK